MSWSPVAFMSRRSSPGLDDRRSIRASHAFIRGSPAREGASCSTLAPVPHTWASCAHIARRPSSSKVQSTSSFASVRAIDA